MRNMKSTLWGLSVLGFVLTAGLVVRTVRAEEAKKEAAAQNWYVIESKHTGPECVKALDDMNSKNLLGKTYWGCMSGDHRGWTILQAPSSDAALKMLPDSQRANAKVVQVGQFTPAELQSIHSSKKG